MSESPPSEPPEGRPSEAGESPPTEQTGDPSGEPKPPRLPRLQVPPGPLSRRFLGVPWLFAVGYSAVGFSVYFSIGVVADLGLGLTPLIFLAAGLLFMLATLTYVEGGAMFLERGGSASFARHAFNELVSFVAGWAILIDYIIVVALAAVSVPHYLSPIWSGFDHGWGELAVAVVVIGFAAAINIAGFTGRVRQRPLIALAIADIFLQVAVIAVGAVVAFHPELLTDHIQLFSTPSGRHIAEALAVATLAFAGIEAASDLAPDLEWEPRDLGRVVSAGSVTLPVIYAGMSAIALMAVPVVPGPNGLHTALGERFIEEPVLGVVMSFDPQWLSTVLQVGVVAIAPAVLAWAATTSMLGLSRHVYVLATNRQVPSWLGKLGRRSTPYIEPDLARPYRMPFEITVRGRLLPVPAIAGAVLMLLLWLAVIVFRGKARWVGGGWMLFGLAAYVIYRRYVERTSITKRVTVPEEALRKEVSEAEYGDILVPIFGTKLDDEIVGTAGRLAEVGDGAGEGHPRLEVIYVLEVPLTVPLDAPPPKERVEAAKAALERAREVGEEYESVEVETDMVPARSVGAAIVDEARRRNVEVIVMGGEPPTRVRGGAVLGGIGGSRPPEVGEVTEYVLKKAPCPVLLTAPPEG